MLYYKGEIRFESSAMFNAFAALLRSSVMLSMTKVAKYKRNERIE